MPAHNLIPILFPKPKKDNIYDMLKKLSLINEREAAIEQGGDANADFYQKEANKWDNIAKDPNLSPTQKLDAEKTARNFELKGLKAAMDEVKELDEKGMDWALTQDLRELEFSLPENPWAFAQEAQTQIRRLLEGEEDEEGLNQRIDILMRYGDERGVRKLEEYRDKLENEELDKYARIQRAFEEKDYDLLSRYGIIYSPFYKGKTKIVEIVELNSVSKKNQTNIKFSVDEGGNLITSTEQGMTMCFDNISSSLGEKIYFNNVEFENLGEMGFVTNNPESFDYQNIKHSTIGDVKAGMFARDSHNQLFYVNKDFTMSPIKKEEWKEELGFSEDKIYNLSPREELNTLPGTISPLPFPISERYNRQAEMSDFDYWDAVKSEVEPSAKKVFGAMDVGLGKAGQFIKEAPGKFLEFTKEGLKTRAERKTKESEKQWGLEELKPSPLIKQGKEYIEKKIKFKW